MYSLPVWTLFSLLFSSGLVAYGGSQVDVFTIGQATVSGTDKNAETALFKDIYIVIICVPHGPSGCVFFGFLVQRRIDEATVTVCPVLEVIELGRIRNPGNHSVVDVPVCVNFTFDFVERRVWSPAI